MPPASSSKVYVLTYGTDSTVFDLDPWHDTISAHGTEDSAIAAGRRFIKEKLHEQVRAQLAKKRKRKRVVSVTEAELEMGVKEGWHDREGRDEKGRWKGMINAKGGFKDLTVVVTEMEVEN